MLLDASGELEDHWPLIPDEVDLPEMGYAVVPRVRLEEAIGHPDLYLGVLLPNDTDPDTLIPHFDRLGLIAVDFPSFADGRGFSIAKRLRALGFNGRLRAQGPVISDQFAYLLACGFDEVLLPEDVAIRQPVEHWTGQLGRISLGYQRGRPGKISIHDQRGAD